MRPTGKCSGEVTSVVEKVDKDRRRNETKLEISRQLRKEAKYQSPPKGHNQPLYTDCGAQLELHGSSKPGLISMQSCGRFIGASRTGGTVQYEKWKLSRSERRSRSLWHA